MIIVIIIAPLGSRDGAVVRALASHQCGPGSIPGPGVICGLSLLSFLSLTQRVFPRVLQFSALHKNQHSKFELDLEQWMKNHSVDVPLKIPFNLFIYLLIYLFIYFIIIVVVVVIIIIIINKSANLQRK